MHNYLNNAQGQSSNQHLTTWQTLTPTLSALNVEQNNIQSPCTRDPIYWEKFCLQLSIYFGWRARLCKNEKHKTIFLHCLQVSISTSYQDTLLQAMFMDTWGPDSAVINNVFPTTYFQQHIPKHMDKKVFSSFHRNKRHLRAWWCTTYLKFVSVSLIPTQTPHDWYWTFKDHLSLFNILLCSICIAFSSSIPSYSTIPSSSFVNSALSWTFTWGEFLLYIESESHPTSE